MAEKEKQVNKSNSQRKVDQKSAYAHMFKPKSKPRSRRWQVGSTGSGKH